MEAVNPVLAVWGPPASGQRSTGHLKQRATDLEEFCCYYFMADEVAHGRSKDTFVAIVSVLSKHIEGGWMGRTRLAFCLHWQKAASPKYIKTNELTLARLSNKTSVCFGRQECQYGMMPRQTADCHLLCV